MLYASKLRHPKWQKLRLEILNRDKWECRLCGDTKTELQIHHLKYTGFNPWDAPPADLITYCKHCHSIIEDSKSLPISKVVKHRLIKDVLILMAVLDDGQVAYFYYYDEIKNKISWNMSVDSYILKKFMRHLAP